MEPAEAIRHPSDGPPIRPDIARICLFDPILGGHHAGLMAGLAGAALDRGHQIEMFFPEPVAPADQEGVRWHPARIHPRRRLVDGRRAIVRAARVCVDEQVGLFCDLFVDRTVWVAGRVLSSIPVRIHVAHHVRQYSPHRPTRAGRLRAGFLRRRLTQLAERGGHLVVHTENARRSLGEFLPPGVLTRLQLPAIHRTDLPPRAPAQDPPLLLFVGEARPEKGLELLLQALTRIEKEVALEVVGRQPTFLLDRLRSGPSSIRMSWTDRFVSSSELDEAYQRASLVVLPYLGSFASTGAASSVLVEAFTRGVPVLTSSVLSDQLPSGYEGAVVVAPDDAETLAAGLRTALERLPHLEEGARRGIRDARMRHSYESYLEGLLEIASRG